MTPRERRAAAQAWQRGGTLGLGAWLAKTKPRFGIKEYSEAVDAARDELGDFIDYSQEGEHDHAELRDFLDDTHV